MKFCSTIALLIIINSIVLQAQVRPLKSGVYHISQAKAIKPLQQQLLEGSSTMLADFEIIVQKLSPGQKSSPEVHPDTEVMVILEKGRLQIKVGNQIRTNALNQTRTVGEGSVAYAAAGDGCTIENVGNGVATYYVLKFKPKSGSAADRKEKSQGSFIVDWNETTFKPHERGGRRDVFDRATNLFARFEMHVTTLNEGLSSHDPHKHNAEEIILLTRGKAEMLIGGENMAMDTWDAAFLDSQVFHGITKGGTGEREYYAFQWEVTK